VDKDISSGFSQICHRLSLWPRRRHT